MRLIAQKLPFLLELFINGSFILLYALDLTNKIPVSWNANWVGGALEVGALFVPIVIFFTVIANFLNSNSFEEYIRKHVFSVLVFIPLLITWGDSEFSFWLSSAHLLSSVLSVYEEDHSEETGMSPGKNLLERLKLRPAQIVLFSFSGMILFGAFLLMLPVSSVEGKALGFVDALFMSTSATCVTGLASVSTGNDLSVFGQLVILALIQVGGLGIMTLTSSMTLMLGKRMGMKDRVVMQDLLDVSSLEDLFAMIFDIIKYTFFIELWGAIVLTFAFTFEGFDFGTALYYGFFHSISAFCNAGFSLFDNSLESYATSPLIHGTVSILITLGGMGFIVLRELKETITKRSPLVRIALHSKIVIITNILLVVGGALFIFFGEFLNALDAYTLWEKVQISVFQSVTLRTAGFNTIPLVELNTYTIYGMTLLMFIGASPGSTGGGIKTTTFAILIQSIRSNLTGQKKVLIYDRTVSAPIVVRATALTFISIIITSFFILILMKLESNQSFLTLFFETVSASGTVGLSLGITPLLSVSGKIAIAALMLIGRIGPLTLLLAIGERTADTGKFDYPDGRIMIG